MKIKLEKTEVLPPIQAHRSPRPNEAYYNEEPKTSRDHYIFDESQKQNKFETPARKEAHFTIPFTPEKSQSHKFDKDRIKVFCDCQPTKK